MRYRISTESRTVTYDNVSDAIAVFLEITGVDIGADLPSAPVGAGWVGNADQHESHRVRLEVLA